MNIPFSVDQFMEVFATYNSAVWPMQIILNLIALTSIYYTIRPQPWSNTVIAASLSFLWLWIGIVYHLIYFSTINPAAYAFGGLNILQGMFFIYYGLIRSSVSFRFQPTRFGYMGVAFIIYGLLVYPILGYAIGHVYPHSPTFGLPCPTTIFTFGMLLLSEKRMPVAVIIIPLLWSVIGFTAALNFGIWEDTGLLMAGIVGLIFTIQQYRTSKNLVNHKS